MSCLWHAIIVLLMGPFCLPAGLSIACCMLLQSLYCAAHAALLIALVAPYVAVLAAYCSTCDLIALYCSPSIAMERLSLTCSNNHQLILPEKKKTSLLRTTGC